MRYTIAKYEKDAKLSVYRTYISESLRLIPQNLYLKLSLAEMLKPKKEINPQKVVDDLVKKGAIKVKGGT